MKRNGEQSAKSLGPGKRGSTNATNRRTTQASAQQQRDHQKTEQQKVHQTPCHLRVKTNQEKRKPRTQSGPLFPISKQAAKVDIRATRTPKGSA